jgi:hypothetical protein
VPFAAICSRPTVHSAISLSWQLVFASPSQLAWPPGGQPLPPHLHAPNVPPHGSDHERF